MRLLSFLTVLVFALGCVALSAGAGQGRSDGVAIVVNDGVVTRSDLQERMKLIMISSGLPPTQEIQAQLFPQVAGSLIDEAIRLQEARRMGLDVMPDEIQQGFAQIAAQNNVPVEQFMKMIASSGIDPNTMRDQIRSQIAWSKVVQVRVRPQISVSQSDIDSRLDYLHSNIGKDEYLVSEIFLPVEKAGGEAEVRTLAQKLEREIRKGSAPFFKIAQQFSKEAGAPQGGNLGWVQQGQLPEELDQVLAGMSKGDLSAPVRTLSGFHLLLLRDKRRISEETMPSREDVMTMIGTERLDRAQRRYFMDLKSEAYVDNRMVP